MANQQKKYTKFVATAATATLVASAIVPVASAASFTDVADTNSHAVNINALVKSGIIGGYPDGTFKPGQELTRGQVVKMLGKWVEAQGVTAPADFATKARFSDLAVNAKDQELVKYAALVADAKVFNGSNDVLNASGKISRENMALVLDRAYTAINGTSLVELAADIEDVKVADLATAKTEAQKAIQALRDLGISSVENFNPKASVTRGQFASFLNKTINTVVAAPAELTLTSAIATSATTLDVVLSDGSKHEVKLEKTLEANKETEVTFKIANNEYKATVTFVVTDFTVASAKAINSKEILVTFNKEINKASLANDGIFNVTVNNGKAKAIKADKVTLQDDKKSVIISLATELVNKDTYKVDVAKAALLAADYQEVVKFAGESTLFTDAAAPTLVSATYNGTDVEFTFNEPLNITGEITKVNGQKVTLVDASTAGKYVYTAEIKLAVGDHTFVITGLEDTVGNAAGTVSGTVTVSNDTTAPTLVSSKAISIDTFELQFSEKLSTYGTIVVKKGSRVLNTKTVEFKDADQKVAVVTVASTDLNNPLYDEDETSIALSYEVTGYKDMATLIGNKATGSVTLKTDEVGPAVLAKNLNKFAKNAYTVVLDETVKTLDASKLTVKKSGILQPNAVNTTKSVITGTDKDQVEVNFTSTLAEGTYTVTFAAGALKDTDGNSNKEFTLEFVVDDTKEFFVLKGTKLAPVVTENAAKANSFIVNYGTEVTESATNVANYTLDGTELPTGSTVEYYGTKEQVLVTLPASYAIKTTAPYTLEISKAVTTKAGAAVAADAEGKKAFTQKIELTDNVAPVLESAELLYVKDATTSKIIELTFSETITAVDADDLVVNIAGVEAKFDAKATDKVITITLEEAVNVAQDITVAIVAEGKKNAELKITDTKGNKVTASSLKVTPVVTK
ncbi:MAG: S-layer homology domain-containing protein [Solibacillus sp.]